MMRRDAGAIRCRLANNALKAAAIYAAEPARRLFTSFSRLPLLLDAECAAMTTADDDWVKNMSG